MDSSHTQQVVQMMSWKQTGHRHENRKRGGKKRKTGGQSDATQAAAKKPRARFSTQQRGDIARWRSEGKSYKVIRELLGGQYTEQQLRHLVAYMGQAGRLDRVEGAELSKAKSHRKVTDEIKMFICALFMLEPALTQAFAAFLVKVQYSVQIAVSTVCQILDTHRISLKSLVVRKEAWNTPETLGKRTSFPRWYRGIKSKFKFIYYDEQNYNVTMRRKRAWALRGLKAVVGVPPRTGGGGAVSLHLAVNAEYGTLCSMVVGKDADQVTTRHFLEELVDTLVKLDKEREEQEARDGIVHGDNRPWMLVLDNDKQHHAAHVLQYLEQAKLNYCFLPPYSPFVRALLCPGPRSCCPL